MSAAVISCICICSTRPSGTLQITRIAESAAVPLVTVGMGIPIVRSVPSLIETVTVRPSISTLNVARPNRLSRESFSTDGPKSTPSFALNSTDPLLARPRDSNTARLALLLIVSAVVTSKSPTPTPTQISSGHTSVPGCTTSIVTLNEYTPNRGNSVLVTAAPTICPFVTPAAEALISATLLVSVTVATVYPLYRSPASFDHVACITSN